MLVLSTKTIKMKPSQFKRVSDTEAKPKSVRRCNRFCERPFAQPRKAGTAKHGHPTTQTAKKTLMDVSMIGVSVLFDYAAFRGLSYPVDPGLNHTKVIESCLAR